MVRSLSLTETATTRGNERYELSAEELLDPDFEIKAEATIATLMTELAHREQEKLAQKSAAQEAADRAQYEELRRRFEQNKI